MERKVLGKGKKLVIMLCVSLLVFSAVSSVGVIFSSNESVAHADALVFHYIAPRNQKSYKKIAQYSGKVSKLKKSGKKIMAISSTSGMIGTIVGAAPFPPAMVVGKVIGAGSATVYLIAKHKTKKFSRLKSGTRWHERIDFKWTKSDKLPYVAKLRYKLWYTYKGKIVGKVSCRYKTRKFTYGERWY